MVRQGLCNVYTQLISVPSGINLHGIIIYTSQPLTWTRKACTLLENFADFCFIQRSKADGTYSYFRQNSLFWILNDYYGNLNIVTLFFKLLLHNIEPRKICAFWLNKCLTVCKQGSEFKIWNMKVLKTCYDFPLSVVQCTHSNESRKTLNNLA